MIPNAPPVGLDDIAKKTGVAVSTVSRALRDLPGIHPDTRTKVLREAELLGYSSRSRKSEKSTPKPRHILILTVGEETPSSYMAGLSRAALQLNISESFWSIVGRKKSSKRSAGNFPPFPSSIPIRKRPSMSWASTIRGAYFPWSNI